MYVRGRRGASGALEAQRRRDLGMPDEVVRRPAEVVHRPAEERLRRLLAENDLPQRGLPHEPLGEHRRHRDEGAGRHPGAGPGEERRAQPGPPPGEVAPRQGAGVDAGGPLQSSSAEDRSAAPASRQSTAAMFPHPPDVSRARAAR
jgi:hypothetical protein